MRTVEFEILGRIYYVTDMGEVYTNYHTKGKFIQKKAIVNKKGYYEICFGTKIGKRQILVHRIIWEAFNGFIPEGYQINHINENKLDNRLENLNLMTPKENCNWGTRNERAAKTLTNFPNFSKPVLQYVYGTNEFVAEYPSIHEAARANNINSSSVSSCCRGLQRQTSGYTFKYKE